MTILSEFQLSLPQKQNRRKVVLATNCVTSMYSRLLGKYKTDDCWKILVECSPGQVVNGYKNLSGVYVVQVDADAVELLSKEHLELKKQALEILVEGIGKIATSKKWDMQEFNRVYLDIKKSNYMNRWKWSKTKSSPDRQHRAEIWCEHDVDAFRVYIEIRDKSGDLVYTEKVITEEPHEFMFASYLGQLKWLSKTKAALLNKDKSRSWEINIEET